MKRGALQPGFVARLIVDQLALEAAALGPAQVHPQQHLGPVLRFGAAGAGMDGDDRVLAIVLAAEHLLDLAGLHFLIERVERLAEFGVDRLRRPRPIRRARRGRRSSCGATAIRSRSCSSRRRRCSTFCASAWSFQKSGAAARASRRVSSSSGRAASKITPQIGGALAEIFVAAHQIVDGRHGSFIAM